MAHNYKYHNGKQFVGGTAALLHQIKEDGGLIPHYEKIVKSTLFTLIEETNKQNVKKSLKLAK